MLISSCCDVTDCLQEPNALAVGIQVPAPDRDTFTSIQDCLIACDNAGATCAGITALSTVDPSQFAKHCSFITADTQPGRFKRTVVRSDLSHLAFRGVGLCPSGYASNLADSAASCIPATTEQVTVFVLRAQGTCSDATIQSVKDALLAFFSDPSQAYGEWCSTVVMSEASRDGHMPYRPR